MDIKFEGSKKRLVEIVFWDFERIGIRKIVAFPEDDYRYDEGYAVFFDACYHLKIKPSEMALVLRDALHVWLEPGDKVQAFQLVLNHIIENEDNLVEQNNERWL